MWLPHPCYDSEAHYEIGRIHLPVAPFCDIQCNYCVRGINSTQNRPGLTTAIISPKKALHRLDWAIRSDPRIRIAAIAGPGEPLANEATFETFALVNQRFPELSKCLSTNGLTLSDKLPRLKEVGVKYLTVTLNAVDPKISAAIYAHVCWERQFYHGAQAGRILLERQLEGIYEASQKGFMVKVNTVLIPGINSDHLMEVAQTIKTAGACIMNIMPLIPVGRFSGLRAPTTEELKKSRAECEPIIKQWYLCKQCRADAVGVPGEEIGTRAQQEACSQIYKEPFTIQRFNVYDSEVQGSVNPINPLTCERLQING